MLEGGTGVGEAESVEEDQWQDPLGDALKGLRGVFMRYVEEHERFGVEPPRLATIEMILGDQKDAILARLDACASGSLRKILSKTPIDARRITVNPKLAKNIAGRELFASPKRKK